MEGGSHPSLQALSPFSARQSPLRPCPPPAPTTADPAARLGGGGVGHAESRSWGLSRVPPTFCPSSWLSCSHLGCLTFKACFPVLKIKLCLCFLVHMRCCHTDVHPHADGRVGHSPGRRPGPLLPERAVPPAELPADSSRGLLLCSVCVSTSLT